MKKTKLGQQLIKGLNEVLAHEKGRKKLSTVVVEIPKPAREWKKEEIALIRREYFKVSQPIFASILSVTPSTIRAWEQGVKKPSGAASRLLELASLDPTIFGKLVKYHWHSRK